MSRVFVAGGTKGLGREISLAFHRRGHEVVALYHDDDAAAASLGVRAVRHDVRADPSALELGEGPLTLVYNAAAPFVPTPFHLLRWEDVAAQMSVTVEGFFRLSQAVLPKMARQGGTIAVVLSVAAQAPPKGFAGYAAAKSALLGMVRGIAAEYPKVRIFTVSPGFMETPLTAAWDERLRQLVAGKSPPQDPAAVAALIVDRTEKAPGRGEDYTLPDVPIARPLLGDEEAEAAAAVVRSGWVMQGPQVEALEREFAAFTGAPHACAVSSGTAALHLALLALGIGPGDEVITVSHSYIATANSIRLAGATPVFVDIDAGYNLDPEKLQAAITPRTRAILCVHQLGMPCDLRRILPFGLPVIEDAACAAGSEIEWSGEWQRIGRPHGTLATFSFHPRKLLTTGDGGMVTTSDPALDRKVRLLRQHGMPRPDAPAELVAFNYRLTDLQAAVGRQQLRRLPALLVERRRQVERYRTLLAGLPVDLPVEPPWARSNWQSFCVRVSDRDAVLRRLSARGISARGGIVNAHQQPPYAAMNVTLPVSEAVSKSGLMLPLFPGMSDEQQDRVVEALRYQ